MSDETTDAGRIARLKELASAGVTGGVSSYFNHLIAVFDRSRRLTTPERRRVDLYLAAREKLPLG